MPQETAAGDAVHTPPREFQVSGPEPKSPDTFQSVPLVSTAKTSVCPLGHNVVEAGPVPAIVWPTRFAATVVPLVWPVTLAALLTTAKSDTSISAAKTVLIVIRLCFIHSTFLD